MAELADVLLANLSGEAPPREALEPILRRLVDEGRAAWPALALAPGAFVRHLATRPRTEALEPWLHATHADDLYLACACAARVTGALDAFEAQFVPRLAGYLAASGLSPATADDVLQSVREKLFVGAEPRIAAYTGRGSLANWLRVVTLRAAVDLSRERDDAIADSASGSSRRAGVVEDPELDFIKEHYRDVFKQAFHDAVAVLDAELRTILRLHYVDGATLEQVAAALACGRSTVVRRIAEGREAILDGVRRLVGERLEIDPGEFDSLLRLLHSRLDLSLARLLRSAP
jgi:RNA polymerase sigma-70 factor (ECF subfamily)